MKTIYEHLGYPITAESFKLGDRESLQYTNKPGGGLWASRCSNLPENSYTWRDWVDDENFNTEKYLREGASHKFTLNDNANVLLLDGNSVEVTGEIQYFLSGVGTLEQLQSIKDQLTTDKEIFSKGTTLDRFFTLNWDYIFSHYDGIELIHGELYTVFHYDGFYWWDVDSICLWNNVIQTL